MGGCDSDSADEPSPQRERITERGLVRHLRALDRIAVENGGERAAGTSGYAASVAYAAREVRRAGWRVRVQRVPMALWRERSPARLGFDSTGGLEPGRDFRVPSYSSSGRAAGALRAVGSGCRASDFDELERGEVALAGIGACLLWRKTLNARRAGARALIVQTKSGRAVPSATLAVPRLGLPVVLLSDDVRPREGERARLSVDTVTERGATQNVIAEAGRGERVVMAGAHLDSVPDGPGINDNGSGVATLLETAVALGPDPSGRKRVRLALWGGEEEGLVGSRRYVRSLPKAELERIEAYLNLDMVGSPNPVAAVYSDGDERLETVLRAAHPGREAGVPAGGRSDHAAFERAGVRTSGLYTGSEERGRDGRSRDPCYHLACDTLANVDRRALLDMARATAQALRDLLGMR